MLKKVEKTVYLCDECLFHNRGSTEWADPCLGGCGKHVCQKHGVHYAIGRSDLDGDYCIDCYNKLTASSDQLLDLYITHEKLLSTRQESIKEFNSQITEVEKQIKELLAAKKGDIC